MNEKAHPSSAFEEGVLEFIRLWLSGNDVWHFKSSGSTGSPKEISVKRSQLLASIKMTAEALYLSKDFTALLCIPVANTGGKMMIARALQLQMKLECVEPSGNPLKKAVHTPDFMAVVPLQLEQMIADEETVKQLEKVKMVIVGGAPVDEALQQKLLSISTPVYATYGMTETVSHIALQLLNTPQRRHHFHVLPGIEIATDHRDCLRIKGPVTNNEWVQTNDRVRKISERQFDWLGRTDLVINSGGHKLQPEVIEGKLERIFKQCGINNSFFIYGLPHEKLGQECTLFIEGEPLDTEILAHLKEEIVYNFSGYEKPRTIRFISKFSISPAGKLDRGKTVANYI